MMSVFYRGLYVANHCWAPACIGLSDYHKYINEFQKSVLMIGELVFVVQL